jgi:hypothetical protein
MNYVDFTKSLGRKFKIINDSFIRKMIVLKG